MSPLLPSLEGEHLCFCSNLSMANLLTTLIFYHMKREIFPKPLYLISLPVPQVSQTFVPGNLSALHYGDLSLNSLLAWWEVWLAHSGSDANRKIPFQVHTPLIFCASGRMQHTLTTWESHLSGLPQSTMLPTASNCLCPWRTHL